MLVETGKAGLDHLHETHLAGPEQGLRIKIALELPHGLQPLKQLDVLQQSSQQHVGGVVGVAIDKARHDDAILCVNEAPCALPLSRIQKCRYNPTHCR